MPILPKDREQVVNEVAILSAANRMSPQQAIWKLGDVEDPILEEKRIKEEMELTAELGKPKIDADEMSQKKMDKD